MQFVSFMPGIEVKGQAVFAVVDGFRHFKMIPSRILASVGIGTLASDGIVQIDNEGWYSLDAWMRAFKEIAEQVGESTLYSIGQRIPENAVFPPWADNIGDAIKAINIAYHMNHQRSGQPMFNPKTGTLMEGIGSYGYEHSPNEDVIISKCNNPYPCKFDHGLLTAVAKRFDVQAAVYHDNHAPCRRAGADSCTYTIRYGNSSLKAVKAGL
jgi:hypothetical protein